MPVWLSQPGPVVCPLVSRWPLDRGLPTRGGGKLRGAGHPRRAWWPISPQHAMGSCDVLLVPVDHLLASRVEFELYDRRPGTSGTASFR